ncbi:MAG: radical SAM protein [Methanobacteriota archaeon]
MERHKAITDCMVREFKGEYFVFNPHKPGWWSGTRTDLDAMRLFDGTRTVEGVSRELVEKHSLPPEKAAILAKNMLALLDRQGFLESEGAPIGAKAHDLDVAYLHLTRRCNLGCSYCYLSAGKGLEGELSTDALKGVIDQVRALGGKVQGIAITGGEPMLHPDFWELCDYAAATGRNGGEVRMWLATNGTLVTEENAPHIAKRFVEVQVSLDGTEEVHDAMRGRGSYSKALRAIRLLSAAGARVKISATVSKKNLRDVFHVVDVAERHAIQCIKTGILMPFGKGDRVLMLDEGDFEMFWREMHARLTAAKINIRVENEGTQSTFMAGTFDGAYSCGAGLDSLSIDADGSVYPCQSSHFPQFRLGGVKESPLEEIWKNSEPSKLWRNSLKIEGLADCRGCVWLRVCGGGCRMHSYAYTGKLDAPSPFCSFTKTFMDEGIQAYLAGRLEKRAKKDGEGAPAP